MLDEITILLIDELKKALLSIFVICEFFENSKDLISLHVEKAPSLIYVTVNGILMELIVENANEYLSMISSLESFGNSKCLSRSHLLNAYGPMTLIKLGIIEFSMSRLENKS